MTTSCLIFREKAQILKEWILESRHSSTDRAEPSEWCERGERGNELLSFGMSVLTLSIAIECASGTSSSPGLQSIVSLQESICKRAHGSCSILFCAVGWTEYHYLLWKNCGLCIKLCSEVPANHSHTFGCAAGHPMHCLSSCWPHPQLFVWSECLQSFSVTTVNHLPASAQGCVGRVFVAFPTIRWLSWIAGTANPDLNQVAYSKGKITLFFTHHICCLQSVKSWVLFFSCTIFLCPSRWGWLCCLSALLFTSFCVSCGVHFCPVRWPLTSSVESLPVLHLSGSSSHQMTSEQHKQFCAPSKGSHISCCQGLFQNVCYSLPK